MVMLLSAAMDPISKSLGAAVVLLVLSDLIRHYCSGSGPFAVAECRLTGSGAWLLLLRGEEQWVDAELLGYSVFADRMVLRFRPRSGQRRSVWIERGDVGDECWRRLRGRLRMQH